MQKHFNRFDSLQHLRYNNKYKLTINNLCNNDYEINFTSYYSPLFSTTKLIRHDLMGVIQELDEDEINYTIWQNSILAKSIAKNPIDEKEQIPYYAKQYVRYKTEIDLLLAMYYSLSKNIGSVTKTVGNMTIEKSKKIPFLKDLLDDLKKKLAPFEKQLIGVFVVGKPAVKAKKYPYPVSERRSF